MLFSVDIVGFGILLTGFREEYNVSYFDSSIIEYENKKPETY